MAIYLDNNSTTHLDARVFEAMTPYLQGPYGNPSSLHRFGRAARDAVEAARAEVAALAGVRPEAVVWTSGGTEADNLAIKGAAAGAARPSRVLYGATEHAAVLETAESLTGQGWQVESIAVRPDGLIDSEAFDRQVAKGPLRLAALMRANNETGVIQDVATVADAVHAQGGWLLVDAVQAAGKIPLDFHALKADLMSLSAHKLHGPNGIGALIKGADIDLTPLHHGGRQEHGLRGGTENLAAIVGFGVAAQLAVQEREARAAHMLALRKRFEAGLKALDDARVFAESAPRLPNTVQFSLPGYTGEALLMALDRKGVAVSSGSACHSGSGEPSHVLLAMGVARDEAFGAIRISFSAHNSEAEVDKTLAILSRLCAELQTA